MDRPRQPQDPSLRAAFWRQEIIEVALWLRGEGFDDRLDGDVLSRFLGLDRGEADRHLDRLTSEGFLARLSDNRYCLSERGEAEGRRIVEGSDPVPEPRRGSCGPVCWCHASRAEAAVCGGRNLVQLG